MQKSKYYTIKRHGSKEEAVITCNNFSLFRYRRFNADTKNDLLEGWMFFSTPSTFNDPYDSSFVYNKNMSKEISRKILKDKNIEINYAGIDYVLSIFSNMSGNLNGIVCLSEKVDNEIMWAHYAENGKGYVLEYDFEQIRAIAEGFEKSVENEHYKFCRLGPIRYINKKYNITKILTTGIDVALRLSDKSDQITAQDIMNNLEKEELKAVNETILYCKNKDWQYEREWRLVAPSPKEIIKGGGSFGNKGIYPKAIYIGEFAEQETIKELINIAKILDVPIYKMQTEMTKNDLRLKPKLIQK